MEINDYIYLKTNMTFNLLMYRAIKNVYQQAAAVCLLHWEAGN